MNTQLTARRFRRLASLLFCGIVTLAEGARAGDTVIFSDGDFGANWVSNKIHENPVSFGATFVSTTQLGGPVGVYRNTSHTWQIGVLLVAHFDAQYTLTPSTTPICSVDFEATLIHFGGQAMVYALALRQNGLTYTGPLTLRPNSAWLPYNQYGLHSEDFRLLAGLSSPDSSPDFSCTGSPIEFGFVTFTATGNPGPFTTVSGIDDWYVTVHLDTATFTDSTLAASDWTTTKIIDNTPGASGITTSTSQAAGGFSGAYRETSHIWTNGSVHSAHLNTLALHNPAIEPVYSIDFAVSCAHLTASSGGDFVLYAGVFQGGSYYGGPEVHVGSGSWTNYSSNALRSTDFTLHAGSGPPHPNFTSTGTMLQFGYFMGTFASGSDTRSIGIDNWTVRANLKPPCYGTLGVATCFGNDITNPCPCYPSVPLGGVGRGCPNSIEPRGALLIGTGTASISNDTVVLQGTDMPSSFCMYFQGTSLVSVPFGDGKFCAGGTIVRLAVKLNICNSSQYPAGNEPSISVTGGIVTPGQRLYQVWYRDSPIFCTPSTFNLTNALVVNWTL
jgi:hypothetical protein